MDRIELKKLIFGQYFECYKLVHGVCYYDEFQNEFDTDYNSNLCIIDANITRISQGERVSGDKFKQLKRNKSDQYPDYEFKSGKLRSYCFKDGNKLIFANGGLRKNQKKDLITLRRIKLSYFDR